MCVSALGLGALAGGLSSGMSTALSVGTSLLSAGMGIMQQAQQAKQQNAYAEAMAKNAAQAAQADYAVVNQKLMQENQKTALDQFERQRQGLRERSKILVAAGEAGLSGATPMRELQNSLLQAGYDVGIMEQSQENALSQSFAEKQGIWAQAKGRTQEAKSMVTKGPGVMDFIGAGLSVASSFVGSKKKTSTHGFGG